VEAHQVIMEAHHGTQEAHLGAVEAHHQPWKGWWPEK
jgi:hypothetical protein